MCGVLASYRLMCSVPRGEAVGRDMASTLPESELVLVLEVYQSSANLVAHKPSMLHVQHTTRGSWWAQSHTSYIIL